MVETVSNGPNPTERSSEAGFTLVEALIAIVILMVGLAAVTNLMIVSATSNMGANQSTMATAAATEALEALKARPFSQLAPGGNISAPPASPAPGYFTPAINVPGVGRTDVRWQISTPANQPNVRFIQVRSQMVGRLGAGFTKTDFTTFRVCAEATGC